MKTVRQLLRQPMKTLFGVMLVATAVAVLCLCLGQSISAKETEQRLDNIYMSIALPSAEYTREADQWAMDYAVANPEIVESVGSPGLIGAYIPKLQPDNYTSHLDLTGMHNKNYLLLPDLNGQEYRSAMLEIVLTELGTPSTQHAYLESDNGGNLVAIQYIDAPEAGAYVSFKGIIQTIVGLAEGYQDPTGFTVSSTLYMPSLEDLESLDLRVGERYLIYSTDYSDEDWWIRSRMTQDLRELNGKLFDAFDPDRLTVLSEEEVIRDIFNERRNDIVAKYRFDGLIHGISRWEYDYIRSIRLFQQDISEMPNYTWEKDENRDPVVVILDYQTYTGKNGEAVTVTLEEYHDKYREPTIVHLEGTVEEFLTNEEGILWREALHNVEINSHAFPMIGVDDMLQIADYAQGKMEIVEGRSFTDDELTEGTKVCILSISLANLNGLCVGDKITVQVYENDPGVPYQINISEGEGSVNPVAYYYFDNTMDLEQAEEYTIIGFYQQDIEWGNVDDNLYAFTPNTIFIPKASVDAQMEYGYAAFFRSFILQNGTIDEFRQTAAEAGFAGMFCFNDNGYSAIEDSMDAYRETAGRALKVGICVYGVMLLLYFVLFPVQQRRELTIMESLGANRASQIGCVIQSGLGIMAPGTVAGIALSLIMWQSITGRMAGNLEAVLEIEMQVSSMFAAAGIQLSAALILTLFVALLMTKNKSMMRKRGE